MSAPSEALQFTKCSACTQYLSFFPIYISRKSEAICGRCSENLTLNDDYVRDSSYEALAKFLKFPCMFQSEGCVDHLKPDEIPNHEKYCPYRIVSCALECVWQGTLNELINHIEELHPNALLDKGEFELSILKEYNTYNYLIFNDEVFLLRRKFDPVNNMIECSVMCYRTLDLVTKYSYEIDIFNGDKSLCVKFPLKTAENFDPESTTQIEVIKLKKELNDPTMIIGNIEILLTKNTDTEDELPYEKIDMDMLGELECPVCLEYIIPPIYQCLTGHSICGDCKNRVSECPSCKEEIKNTINFSLEKIAYRLNYPCKYMESGCTFISNPSKIKSHQKYCQFAPQDCPLKEFENCNWRRGIKDIYPHVLQDHYDSILDVDRITVFLNNRAEDQCYIKKFGDKLFRLHYRSTNDAFYWSMQLIGPSEEAKNFRFEIDIIDCNDTKQKIFLRSLCTSLCAKDAAFQEPGTFVYLRLDQIRPLISTVLKYIVRIVK